MSPGARRVSRHPFLLLRKQNQLSHPRIGVIVPNRHCASLVQRNLIKRLIRESFRLIREQLPAEDLAVLVRRDCRAASRHTLGGTLDSLWRELRG